MSTNKHESSSSKSDIEALKYFKELISSIHALKDKKSGCPWHKEQNYKSLFKYLIEETDEYMKAVLNKNTNNMKEELGDILFQVMLHAEIGREKSTFELKDIIYELDQKIKKRHPYIFQKKEKVTIKEAQEIWNAAKNEEDHPSENATIGSYLSNTIKHLPPHLGTTKISQTIQGYGFKWKNINEIVDKLEEETNELKQAIHKKDSSNIMEELGDAFFTLINLALFLNINYQDCLRYANNKFINRFSIIEKNIDDRIDDISIEEFKNLWQKAKKNLQ